MNMGTSWAELSGSGDILTLYLGLAFGVLLLVGLGVVISRMQKIRKECRQILAKRYKPKDIICHDNLVHYLGMDLVEGKQTRGKGILVLAEDELYFLRLHPRLELCIPLKRMKRIMTPLRFLDISSPTPLLMVSFQDEDGALCSVAWKIRDVASFAESLKAQRKKVQPRRKKG